MEDIQSWWELPSIAHFCSLFRAAFDLLDFDIEELEEAILTDGLDRAGSPLLIELLVRLIQGCLPNKNVTSANFEFCLKKLFKQKCQEDPTHRNLFCDGEFRTLTLRRKVEILHSLCDFRLEAEDVLDVLKNLETESLRVEPLGFDDHGSTYWYFYGTRLYREDNSIFHPYRRRQRERDKQEGKRKKKRKKRGAKEEGSSSDENEDQYPPPSWQVQCYSEEDWRSLSSKFESCDSRLENSLSQTLIDDFLPEIPRLFEEKEKLQQKRMLEFAPRRSSGRVQKMKEKKDEEKEKKQKHRKFVDKEDHKDLDASSTSVLHNDLDSSRISVSSPVNDEPSNEDRVRERLREEPLEEHTKEEEEEEEPTNEEPKTAKSESNQKPRRKKKQEAALFDKRKERWRQEEDALEEPNNLKSEAPSPCPSPQSSPLPVRASTPPRDHKQKKHHHRKHHKRHHNHSRKTNHKHSPESSSWDHSIKEPKEASDTSNKENRRSDDDGAEGNDDEQPPPQLYKGRKTNNSLSSLAFSLTPAGVVPEPESEIVSSPPNKKKVKSAHMLLQTEDDLKTGMYKVLEQLKAHEDAWPFLDAVDDSFAPNYYAVIRRPMFISRMEARLDSGYYSNLSMFEADFKLMMDNCKLYNGPDSEYTHMAYTLEKVFSKLKSKYLETEFSSDEEMYIDLSFQESSKKKKRRSTEEKEEVDQEEDGRRRGKSKKRGGRKSKSEEHEREAQTEKRPRGRPKYTDEDGRKKSKKESISRETNDLESVEPEELEDEDEDFEEPLLLVREDPYPEGEDEEKDEANDSDGSVFRAESPIRSPLQEITPVDTPEEDILTKETMQKVSEEVPELLPKRAKRGRPKKVVNAVEQPVEAKVNKSKPRTPILETKNSSVDVSDSDSGAEGGVFLYYRHEDTSSDEEKEASPEKKSISETHNELFGEIDDLEEEEKLEAEKENVPREDSLDKEGITDSRRKSESRSKKRHHRKGEKRHHHHHHHHHHHRHKSKTKTAHESSSPKQHGHRKKSKHVSVPDSPSKKVLKVEEVFDFSDDQVSRGEESTHSPVRSPVPASPEPGLPTESPSGNEKVSSSHQHSRVSHKKRKSRRKDKHGRRSKRKAGKGKNKDKHEKKNSKKRRSIKKIIKKKRKEIPLKKMAAIDALSAATEQTLKDITCLLDDPHVPRFNGESPTRSIPSPTHCVNSEEFEPVAFKIEAEYRRKLKMDPTPEKKQHKKKRKTEESSDQTEKKKIKKEPLDTKEIVPKVDKEWDGELSDSGILDNTKELFKDIKDGRIKPGAIIKSKDIAKKEGVVKKESKTSTDTKSKAKQNPFGKINKQENTKLTSLIAKAKESRIGLVPNSELGDSPKLSLGSIIMFGDIGSKRSSREPNSADEDDTLSEKLSEKEKWDSPWDSRWEKVSEKEKWDSPWDSRWEKSDIKDELSDPPSQPMEEEEEREDIEEQVQCSPVPETNVEDLVPPPTPTPVNRGPELRQEKATPNLSAWFKAFGGPKSTPTRKQPEDEDSDALDEEDLKEDCMEEEADAKEDSIVDVEEEIRVCSPVEFIPEEPPPSPRPLSDHAPSPEPQPSPPSPPAPHSPEKPPNTPWFDKISEKEDEPIWKKNKTEDDDEDPYKFEEEELDRAREEAKKLEVERQRKASVSSSGFSDPSPLNIDTDRSPAAFSSEGERSPLTRSPATRSPMTPGFGGAKSFSPATEKSPGVAAYSPRLPFDEKSKYQANGPIKVGFYQDNVDKSQDKSDTPKSLEQKLKESPIYSPTVPYVSPLYSNKDQNIGKQKSPVRFSSYYTSIDSSALDKPPKTPGYYPTSGPSTPSDKPSPVGSLPMDDKSKTPTYNYYSYDPTKSLTDQYKNTDHSASKPYFPNVDVSPSPQCEKVQPSVAVPSGSRSSPPPQSAKFNEKVEAAPPKKRQSMDRKPAKLSTESYFSSWEDKREELEKTLNSAPFRNPFSPHALPANLANLSHIVSRIPDPETNDSMIPGLKDTLRMGSDTSRSQTYLGKPVQSSGSFDSSSQASLVPVPDHTSPLADLAFNTHLMGKAGSLNPPAAHQKAASEAERPRSRAMPPPPEEKSHPYLHQKTMWSSTLPCSIPSSLSSLVSSIALSQKGLSFSSDPLAQFGMDRAALASLAGRSQATSQLFHHDLLQRNSSQSQMNSAVVSSSSGLSLQSHLDSNTSTNTSMTHSRRGTSSGSSSGSNLSNPTASSNSSNANFDLSLARSYTNMIGANQSSSLFGRGDATSPFISPSPGLGAALGIGVNTSRTTPTPAHQQSLSQGNFRDPISQSHLNSIGSGNQNQSLGHLNPASLASYTSRDSLALMSQAGRNPIVGVDATSQQLYQQYLQRHQMAQEELLLRSAGAHTQLAHQSMMLQQGLMSAAAASYPSGYPHSLGLRSGPYQGMNRPWI